MANIPSPGRPRVIDTMRAMSCRQSPVNRLMMHRASTEQIQEDLRRLHLELSQKTEELQAAAKERATFYKSGKNVRNVILEKEAHIRLLQSDITCAINANSANELQDIFGKIRTMLPIELREAIYRFLFESERPTILPQEAMSYNPFQNDYYLDRSLVGSPTALEIRDLYMRAIPTYIQIRMNGSNETSGLNEVLGMYFHETSTLFRNMIRHVRLLLRCEDFNQSVFETQSSVPSVLRDEPEYQSHGELFALEKIRSSLTGLKSLPYDRHHITVEICILQSDELPRYCTSADQKHKRVYNLLETVKEVYLYAKNAGANVSVSVQNHHSAMTMDATWQLDLDAVEYTERQRPIYFFVMQDESPPERRSWITRIQTALDGNHSLQAHLSDLPWLQAFALQRPCPHFHGVFGDLFFEHGVLENFDFDSFLQQPGDEHAFDNAFDFEHVVGVGAS